MKPRVCSKARARNWRRSLRWPGWPPTSFLRAGDSTNAIAALEQANASGDTAVSRTLALAYLAANRGSDALPLLARYLEVNPRDQDTLLSGIYATYVTHLPTARPETIAADRAGPKPGPRRTASLKGERQALVDLWIKYLQGLK